MQCIALSFSLFFSLSLKCQLSVFIQCFLCYSLTLKDVTFGKTLCEGYVMVVRFAYVSRIVI